MSKLDIQYYIFIYGPESDYTYQAIEGINFTKLKDAKAWIARNIPKHLGYKIMKTQTVYKQAPRRPHYVQ